MYKRRLRKRKSLFSIGTLVGDLDGMSIYRRLLETVKEGCGNGVSLYVSSGTGTWKEGFLLVALKDE